MKKVLLFMLLMLVTLGVGAKSVSFAPANRVTTFQEGKQYMIFNTAYTSGSYAKRYGAIYADGTTIKTYGGAVPETFTVSETTSNYLFTLTVTEFGQYVMSNAAGTGLGTFTIGNYVGCSSKSSAQSRNDDGTFTAAADITEDMNLVYIYNSSTEKYWNGNNWSNVGDNCFALWTNAHPYAIYEVAEVTIVDVTYILMEGGEEVTRKVVQQHAGSAVNVPDAFGSGDIYDYDVQGTVGDDDCEVVVTRTLKPGIVASLADLSNDKVYTLACERGALGVHNNSLASTYQGDITEAGRFSIVSYEEKRYLYSLDDDKFIVGTGQESDQPTTVLNLSAITSEVRFLGMLGSNGINVTGVTNGVVVNYWVTPDEGNKYLIKAVADLESVTIAAIQDKLEKYFHPSYTVTYKVVDESGADLWVSAPVPATLGETISEMPAAYKNKSYTTYTDGEALTVGEDNEKNVFVCTATFNLPFESFTSFEDAKWYKATLRGSKQLKYDSTAEPYPTNTAYADSDEYKWAFQGNPYTGIAVYNKATGENMTLTTVDAGSYPIAVMRDGVQRWTIQQGVGYSDGFLLLDEAWASNAYINDNANTLRFWVNDYAVNDNGSTWRLEEILSAHDQLVADLAAAIAALNSKNYGSDYGQFGFTGEYAGYKGMENVLIPGLISEAQSALDAEDDAQMTTALANVQDLAANLALNLPVNGSAFRIKSIHDTYLTGNVSGESSSARYLFQTDADASTIWFYADGVLYNYSAGAAFKGRGDASTVTEFGFEGAVSDVCKYNVRFLPGSGQRRYLYAWGPSDANANKADQNSSEATNTLFSLEAVAEIPVEVGEMQYTTLYLPVGVQAVEGLTLNTVSLKGEDQLTLESVESIEPRTAVVVNAPVPGVYNLPVVKNGTKVDENILTGVAFGGETLADDVNAYVLNEDGLGAGFFLWNEDTRVMKSWKAYFVPGTEPTVQAYRFTEATGLNKAGLQRGNDSVVFDLQGRRVEKAQKGLYIVNGQKVLVK